MNLLNFMNQVDEITMKLPKEKLNFFLHNLARRLPETERADFLKNLRKAGERIPAGDSIPAEESEAPEKKLLKKELKNKILQLEKKLHMIEEGELCIVGNLNEEYDDWYSSISDEFIFEDPKRVIRVIEDACDLVHECVDCEAYQEGYKLAKRLIELEIAVSGDYSEYAEAVVPMHDLVDMGDIGLDRFNHRQLILDTLYAAYYTILPEKRPEEMYSIICDSGYQDISLETLIQEGEEELPLLSDFLNLWIDYLGAQTGRKAEELLREAIMLKNESGQSLELARRFKSTHPGLFEQILKSNLTGNNNEEMLLVGQEALQAIEPQYVVRSQTALLTAVYALRLNQQAEAERCWLEAFRSDTRPVHYLRLMAKSRDFSVYREEVGRIYRPFFETVKHDSYAGYQAGDLCENRIDRDSYYTLAFFDGNFSQVLGEGMNTQEALGWSSTFMKCGIALFLLSLFEAEELPAGCRSMCETIICSISFTAEKYSLGLLSPAEGDDISLFWLCFRKWKKIIPIQEADKRRVIKQLVHWISLRVEAILHKTRRNYYGECAAFIAALGEVLESRGEEQGKAKLMESYRAAYPRHSAFREELRNYGMKDGNRKK